MNGFDKAGSTPLHWAAHGGHVECARLLMEVHNCQVNVQVSVMARSVLMDKNDN